MATSDLCTTLQRHAAFMSAASSSASPDSQSYGGSSINIHKGPSSNAAAVAMIPPLDVTTERRICTAILALLDDDSNDVQAIAVKTLGVLLTTVHEEQVLEIANRLITLILDETKSDLRDVYTIGLRTLVKTISPPSLSSSLSSSSSSSTISTSCVTSSFNNNNNNTGNAVCMKLIPRLIEGIHYDGMMEDIKLACLDILTDLLTRCCCFFGGGGGGGTSHYYFLAMEHERILSVLLRQLGHVSAIVKKRTGLAIGYLAVIISDVLLFRLVDTLLSQINMYGEDKKNNECKKSKKRTTTSSKGSDCASVKGKLVGTSLLAGKNGDNLFGATADTRALIRTMCTISGTVGHRLANQIDRIVPIFLRFCDPFELNIMGGLDGNNVNDGNGGNTDHFDNDARMDYDNDVDKGGDGNEELAEAMANDLRESCFAGFESFIIRCPVEIQGHIPKIIEAALAYMKYDPNYSYGDDDETDGTDSANIDYEEEDDEDELDEGFSDDDLEDVSDDEDESWKVRRSAIRTLRAVVDSMKSDPIRLWTEYGVAGALVKRFKEREENCRVDVIDCFTRLLSNTLAVSVRTTTHGGDAMDLSSEDGADMIAAKFIPTIIKSCEHQLKAKKGGERTKSSALALLSTTCSSPGGIGGTDQIAILFTRLRTILSDPSGSKSLKLEALSLVRVILSTDNHKVADLQSCLVSLLPELCRVVNEDWYKVIAEALRVLAVVPRLAIGIDNDKLDPSIVASMLFSAVQPRLAAHDLDQEIKECALAASASLLSALHPFLSPDQKQNLLKLILERLRNEITRLAALKTLAVVALAKNPPLDISSIFGESLSELAALLRQQNRGIKQSSLEALDIVVGGHGANMDATLCEQVLREAGVIITDTDLHISHLSM